MKVQTKLAGVAFMLLCLAGMQLNAQAQGPTRDPLRGLKRAISDASAPALTATQETAITAAITAYKDALPDEPDTALQTAHDAFEAAILAGNQTAITTAANAITTRSAQLLSARLLEEAKFDLAVIASLKSGGQYDPLVTKFTAARVLDLVESLVGGGGFGGPGGGRH